MFSSAMLAAEDPMDAKASRNLVSGLNLFKKIQKILKNSKKCQNFKKFKNFKKIKKNSKNPKKI
jgi:hypothetical protein